MKTIDGTQSTVIRNMAALALDLLAQEGAELLRRSMSKAQELPADLAPAAASQCYIILGGQPDLKRRFWADVCA